MVLNFKEYKLSELQDGHDCGFIALKITRSAVVEYILANIHDENIKKLLLPEIRTLCAVEYLNVNIHKSDNKEQEVRLNELLDLYSVLIDMPESQQVLEEIRKIVSKEKSLSQAARHNIVITEDNNEIIELFMEYETAHTNAQLALNNCNELLEFRDGHRKNLDELKRYFVENIVANVETRESFTRAQEIIETAKAQLDGKLLEKDLQESYIKNYYGKRGWVAFQPNQSGGDNSSIIDIIAQMKECQIIIWQNERDTDQLKIIYNTQDFSTSFSKQVHIRYNGVNHFTSLELQIAELIDLSSIATKKAIITEVIDAHDFSRINNMENAKNSYIPKESKVDTITVQELEDKYLQAISAGNNALRLKHLKKAEDQYVEAFNLAIKIEDFEKQAKALEGFGDFYCQKAQQASEEDSSIENDFDLIVYNKGIALYNAALARSINSSYQEILIQQIKRAEQLYLQSIGISDELKISTHESDTIHQTKLKGIRIEASSKIKSIEDKYKILKEYDGEIYLLDDKQEREKIEALEKQRIEDIKNLYVEITNEMKSFIKTLLGECIEVLGEPSCEYSIIGLGSMARGEMTPYSDFEWAILIADQEREQNDQNKNYFRNLANLLHIKVLNLGETIIPAMNIKLWKGYSDYITPRGFSFDSFSLGACKTPLGNMHLQDIPEKDRFELIKTPEEMAYFLSNENTIDSSWHLDKVLFTSVSIISRDSNDNLYHEYVRRVIDILDPELCQDRGKDYLLEQAGSNIVRVGTHTTQGRMLDIKYTFYRIPTLQLDSLTYLYKLQSKSTLDRLEELSNVSIFDNEEVKEFFTQIGNILASIQLLRLKNYLKHNKQDDHIIDKDMLQLSESFSLSQDKMHWMLQSLLTFADLMVHFIEVEKVKEIKENENLSENLARLSITKIIKSKLIDYHMLNSIYAYDKLEMFDEAEKQCERLIKECQEAKDFEGEVEIATQLAKIYSKEGLGGQEQRIIGLLQPIYDKLKNSNEKIEINELKKYDIRIKYIVEFLSNLGGAYFTINVKKSKVILEQAHHLFEEHLRNSYGNNNDNELSFIKASILNEYGRVLCETGEGVKAVELLGESIQTTEEKFGQAHQDLALRYNNLGQAFASISDYENAIIYYEKAITMLSSNRIINNNVIILIYINLSEAYLNLEKPNLTQAKEFIDKAEKSYKVLPEECNYLQLKYYLIAQKAVVCNALGEYTKATEDYLEAWKLALQINNSFSNKKLSILTEPYISKQIDQLLALLNKCNFDLRDKVIKQLDKFLVEIDFLKHADSVGLLFLIGRYHFYKGELEHDITEAFTYYEKSIRFLQKAKFCINIKNIGSLDEKYAVYHYLGHVYTALGHIEIANKFEAQAIEYLKQHPSHLEIQDVLEKSQANLKERPFTYLDLAQGDIKFSHYLAFASIDCDCRFFRFIATKNMSPIIKIDSKYNLVQYNDNGKRTSTPLDISLEEESFIANFVNVLEIELNNAVKSALASDLNYHNDHLEDSVTSLYFIKPVYNNPFLNHPEIVESLHKFGGKEAVNLFLDLGTDQDIAEQLLQKIEEQGLEVVLSMLFNKQPVNRMQEMIIQENANDQILLMIDRIKNIVGENESNKLVGYLQYVTNSLSHNLFTSSAKQVIKIMGNLVQNLEELLDISLYAQEDGIMPYESYVTVLWTQLAYFFDYVESGQRMFSFMPRSPYFDPDSNGGPGDGYNDDENGRRENDYSDYAKLIFSDCVNVSSIFFVGDNNTYLE